MINCHAILGHSGRFKTNRTFRVIADYTWLEPRVTYFASLEGAGLAFDIETANSLVNKWNEAYPQWFEFKEWGFKERLKQALDAPSPKTVEEIHKLYLKLERDSFLDVIRKA